MPYDGLTFGLALAGYTLLALDATARATGRRAVARTVVAVAVIAAHVLCVWGNRFEWSFARMWQKSAFAFVLFHGAFAILVLSLLVREPLRTRLVLLGFAIVCLGALPAPFRYEELAWLRVPVPTVFALAVGWAAVRLRRPELER